MTRRTEPDLPTRLISFLLLALLMFGPLFRSGKVSLAMLLLEVLAVAAMLVLWWQPGRMNALLGRGERVFLGVLVALPLLQLLPLPFSRLSLPGQGDYYAAQQLVDAENWATLSLLPRETLDGWLLLMIPVGTYLAGRFLQRQQLNVLMHVVLAMAAFQALLGLLQFGTGSDSVFYMGMTGLNEAVGTYTSRNNYVGFMYCALMVSLALFMATLGRHKQLSGKQTLRQKLVYLSTGQGHRAFIYGVLALLFLLAVIFSRSRAGISVTMLGVLLAALVFARRIGGDNVYGLTGSVISAGGALAVAIGLGPVLQRFTQLDPVNDGRTAIFRGVFEGIGQFFPLGAGAGTFRDSFPAFQNMAMMPTRTINRAHNSFLEWVYDGGVLALLLIVFGLLLYVLRWRHVWKVGIWGEFRFLQAGAGLGMLLMLLHDTVDYNLFVPANMIYFAFLAAVFFYPYTELKAQRGSKRSHTVESRSRTVLRPAASLPVSNPFLDGPPSEEAPVKEADTPLGSSDDWPHPPPRKKSPVG